MHVERMKPYDVTSPCTAMGWGRTNASAALYPALSSLLFGVVARDEFMSSVVSVCFSVDGVTLVASLLEKEGESRLSDEVDLLIDRVSVGNGLSSSE